MLTDDRAFRKRFFQAMQDEPLEPSDPRYVDLYERGEVVGEDPVKLLAEAIEFTPVQSVQLFSGFRNGDDWYDVHPLIAEHIREQAASLRAKQG